MGKNDSNSGGRTTAADSSNPFAATTPGASTPAIDGSSGDKITVTRVPAPTGAQAPSVGRIVHYQPADGEHIKPRAAIITEVGDDGQVSLRIFPPNGESISLRSVPYAERPTGGAWNWPPRV